MLWGFPVSGFRTKQQDRTHADGSRAAAVPAVPAVTAVTAVTPPPQTMSAPDSDSEGPPMGCDRRLSRAARTVLVRDFLPVLRRHRPPGGAVASSAVTSAPAGGNGPADPSELWAHLEAHLGDASSCPLHPNRDVLREHEARAEIAPNPSYRGRYDDPRVRHQGGEMVHRCGICGREFHGRYYLDRHMDRRHAPPSLASNFDSDSSSSSSSSSSSPIAAVGEAISASSAANRSVVREVIGEFLALSRAAASPSV